MWAEASKESIFGQAVLIGTGLIGGSMGFALKNSGLVHKVLGYDLDTANLHRALELGAVDQALLKNELVPPGTDLLIFATPVRATLKILPELAGTVSSACLVTDTGSTKEAVMKAFRSNLPSSEAYVGGHPMAGSEDKGIEAADPALFKDAIYVLVEEKASFSWAYHKMRKLILKLGAKPLALDAQEHDRLVSLVSHLPHMVAVSLVEAVRKSGEKEDMDKILALAAGGFRDTTRVALSNPVMWRDICLTNNDCIKQALLSFRLEIDLLLSALEDIDDSGAEAEDLFSLLRRAKNFRSQVPPKKGKTNCPERKSEAP